MTLVTIPEKLLIEADHDWNIVGNTMGAGQSSVASVDVRSDGGGFWVASLNNIQFLDASYTLLWRAIRQIANGGVTPLIVRRNETLFAPFPLGEAEGESIPHSDDSLFSDGAGYYQTTIDVVAAESAALRATSLAITRNYCAELQGGEVFSILHPTFDWRMYEIATVDDDVITFNPPLREAVTAGTQLEFDRPRCTMKLLNPAAMDLNIRSYPFSLASVKFVESKYGT